MAEVADQLRTSPAATRMNDLSIRVRRSAEYIAIPLIALVASAVLFSIFLLALGKSPADFFQLVIRGGFSSAFSLQNTLQRSLPYRHASAWS